MTETLKAKCPYCKAPITLPLMRVATEVRYRTCRKCGQRWQVKTTPLMTKPGMMVHQVDFQEVER